MASKSIKKGLALAKPHHYFGIDLKVVWDVVDIELPKLRESIDALL